MKITILILLIVLIPCQLFAQETIDSLIPELEKASGTHKIDILNRLNFLYLNRDVDKGIHYGTEALQLSEHLDYAQGRIEALGYLGRSYFLMGDNKKAVDYFQQALELLGDDVSLEITGYIYEWLGQTYRRLSNYKEALDFAKKAYSLFNQKNDRTGLAHASNSLGMIFWRISEYDSSLAHFDEALILREALGDNALTAATYNNIGVVHYQRAYYGKALEYYMKSLRLREKISDNKGIAIVLSNIGKTYKDWGKTDEAMDYFTRSLNTARDINDNKSIGYALHNIGSIYEIKVDYDSSLVYYGKSLDRYKSYGKAGVILNLNSIANVHNLLGNYNKALEITQKAYDEAVKAGIILGQATALRNMGISFLNKKEMKKALDNFNQSLALSLKIGQRELEKENYQQISNIYAALNDSKNALKYFKLYSTLKDSLFNQQTARNIDRMKILYETEKKDKENEILRREKEVQKQEISRNKIVLTMTSIVLILIASITVILYNLNKQKKKANVLLGNTNKEISRQHDEIEIKNKELETALSQIKRLYGLIPICANCKKIRDDTGYWSDVEAYISEHSDAVFSHGICPECIKKLYPEFADKVNEKNS